MIKLFIFALLSAATIANAQTTEVPVLEENPALPAPEVKPTFGERAASVFSAIAPIQNVRTENNYFASFNYSALDFPIPGKWGVTAGLMSTPDRTWELEYLKGSYSVPGGFRDLGSINDTRISLIARSYFGNSFNFAGGISYFDFTADVGDKLISNATQGAYPSMNAMTVRGFGAYVGIGNSWTFRKNITLGIDWIAIAQPIYITKRTSDFRQTSGDASANQSIDDTMKIISYLPRFALLSAHLGMVF
jgi:hypothetical protein